MRLLALLVCLSVLAGIGFVVARAQRFETKKEATRSVWKGLAVLSPLIVLAAVLYAAVQ